MRDVSLDLHEGEVVGLTGLIGSGFDEIPYLLYGARPARSGGSCSAGRPTSCRSSDRQPRSPPASR